MYTSTTIYAVIRKVKFKSVLCKHNFFVVNFQKLTANFDFTILVMLFTPSVK